jgi:phage baseplate assembly protein gpV
MKKLLIIAFTLAIATSAFAQPGKVKARYSGTIDTYDAATKTLTVNQKDRKGVFIITDTSEVMKDKTKADASALVAGQKVDVEFVMDGATKLVQKVKVSGAAASKN